MYLNREYLGLEILATLPHRVFGAQVYDNKVLGPLGLAYIYCFMVSRQNSYSAAKKSGFGV